MEESKKEEHEKGAKIRALKSFRDRSKIKVEGKERMRKQNAQLEYPAGTISRLKRAGKAVFVDRVSRGGVRVPFLNENGSVPETGMVYNTFDIDSFEIDHATGRCMVKADIRFAQECSEITLYADLLDESREKLLKSFEPQTVEHSEGMVYSVEGSFQEAAQGDTISVIVYADWKDGSGAESYASLYDEGNEYKVEYTHVHPAKYAPNYKTFGNNLKCAAGVENQEFAEKSRLYAQAEGRGQMDAIVVSLYRLPEDRRDLDYLCQFGKAASGAPILCVPARGIIKMRTMNAKFVKEPKASAVCAITSADTKGALVVASSSSYDNKGKINIHVTDKEIHYDMEEAWGVEFREPGGSRPFLFDYEMVISCYVEIDGVVRPQKYFISSVKEKGGNCLLQIPKVVIKWGCLDGDTLIMVSGGSQCGSRRIAEITVGDMVLGADGTACRVKNVWSGEESGCVRITAENRQSVTASDGHPFLTQEGWKTAGRICAGDKMTDRDGAPLAVQKIERLSEKRAVYNLEFDAPTVIIADGFRTGDYAAQNGQFQ